MKVVYALLYSKWITNKDRLYSTWNSMLCASLDGRGVRGRMDTWICMAEFLRCASETTTIFLIGYTPTQNVFGVKIKKEVTRLFQADRRTIDSFL